MPDKRQRKNKLLVMYRRDRVHKDTLCIQRSATNHNLPAVVKYQYVNLFTNILICVVRYKPTDLPKAIFNSPIPILVRSRLFLRTIISSLQCTQDLIDLLNKSSRQSANMFQL
jgi:hypothetical protein